jgi:hypothetical protein
MTDFTPKQARQWVEQELGKHTTPQSAARRIAAEKQMLAIIQGRTLADMPNSEWAHNELVRRLQQVA